MEQYECRVGVYSTNEVQQLKNDEQQCRTYGQEQTAGLKSQNAVYMFGHKGFSKLALVKHWLIICAIDALVIFYLPDIFRQH
jgi:hypothetical protein